MHGGFNPLLQGRATVRVNHRNGVSSVRQIVDGKATVWAGEIGCRQSAARLGGQTSHCRNSTCE